MDDKGIIDLYFARDENAVSETMKSYNGRLLRFAMRFLSDQRDAEECVNDTYIRAWDIVVTVTFWGKRICARLLCTWRSFMQQTL